MTTEDMIRALGNVIEEYKNKPVFTGKTDIPMMCRDVIGKLKELSNPWHTGTPTEYGLYLVQYIHGGYDVVLYDPSASGWDIYSDDSPKDVVKWQKIEENEDGREETETSRH